MALGSMRSRAVFFTFVGFLACLTSSTVICFSMAILDDAFVYAGIACLVAVVLLIGTYTGCRYCFRSGTCANYGTRSEDSAVRAEQVVDEDVDVSQLEFRRLEREIEDLFAEVSGLQSVALCNSEALERQSENLRREFDQLSQWIEGRKTPETTEVRALEQRLDSIRNSLRSIRRRSDRITSALGVRPFSISTTSLSRPVVQLPQPPTYEDSRRHLANDRSPNSTAYAVSYLPSYSSSEPRVPLGPPADDIEAPPPYEEAIGTPV